jgi:hypothetical protein
MSDDRRIRGMLAVLVELIAAVQCQQAVLEQVLSELSDPEKQAQAHEAIARAGNEIEELKKLWTLET